MSISYNNQPLNNPHNSTHNIQQNQGASMNHSRSNENQLFVNLAFDMDMFELTKIEPLKRYEENLHLLSKVFANKNDQSDILNKSYGSMNNISNDNEFSDSLEQIYSYINNKQNNNKEEVIELLNNLLTTFNNNSKNDSNNNTNNDIKMTNDNNGVDWEFNKMNEKKSNPNSNSFEELLISQLRTNLEEYYDMKNSCNLKLKNFANERENYKALYNKFKNVKNRDEIMSELNDTNNIIFKGIHIDNLGIKKEEKSFNVPFKKGEVISYISL